MTTVQKAVCFFCMDPARDEVAPRVFEASRNMLELRETPWIVDGYPVLSHDAGSGNEIYYVRTETVICMAYDRYLPIINTLFADCSLGVMVNWHGGQNAPDRVLCVHTVGDVTGGVFGASAPKLSTHLARLLEACRADSGLEDFSVTTEATHWSGIVYGGDINWISDTAIPFLDVEIGSTSESYGNARAAKVIAQALAGLFSEAAAYPTVLYCGGMHFEDTITSAVLHPTHPVSLTHILPSRWMETDRYMGESGLETLKACITSIAGGVDGFAVHEKLKREQRELIDTLARQLGLPVIKRKALKNPDQTVFYT